MVASVTPPITLGTLARAGIAVGTINGLGDSITAQPVHQPRADGSPTTVPARQPSTAYTVGQVVGSGGYSFYCSVAGTTGSSTSALTVTTTQTDGGVTWTLLPAKSNKDGFLGWAEIFSGGRLIFDQSQGYGGLAANSCLKVIVRNGGTGYAAGDTLSFSNGGSGTLTLGAGGTITGVTVVNPGYNGNTSLAYTITTSTGSGAVLSLVSGGHGTFGTSGCKTPDMVARLPDVVASAAHIITVMGGINNLTANDTYANITADLRTCYETLMAAGKKVVACCILPSNLLTAAQAAVWKRVNRWIRAYCRGESWANPSGFTEIALADVTRLALDRANLTSTAYPIGGTGGTAASVTVDGTHPNTRLKMYIGYAVWLAAQRFVSPAPLTAVRADGIDGYDATLNPGGNLLEAQLWTAGEVITAVGTTRQNSGAVYRCTTPGTCAASGGPTGAGSSITDGTVTWAYVRVAGLSVFASGTGSAPSTVGSVTGSGTLAKGLFMSRLSGSAAGTIVAAIENPWSDGTPGNRQSLVFSLGSGTTSEQWYLQANFGNYASFGGLTSTDLGVTSLSFEVEVELSGLANLYATFEDGAGMYARAGATLTGAGHRVIGASGDPVALPNGGKLRLVTTPMTLTTAAGSLALWVYFGFDASGAAGSATATAKINYVGLHRARAA